jgi:hypothetical protein
MDARRRLRLMLLLLVASLGGTAGFSWLMNPFGRWEVAVVGRRYRSADPTVCTEHQRERMTVPYRLRAAHPEVVLVGSSRVQCGLAIDHAAGDGYLNAALRGASVPEVAALVEVAAANPALRRVFWAVDFFAFDGRYVAFQDPDMPRRLRGETAWADAVTTLRRDVWDLDAYRESWRVLGRVVRDRPRLAPLFPAPWPPEALAQAVGDGEGLARYDDGQLRRAIRGAREVYGGHQAAVAAAPVLDAAVADLRRRGIEVTVLILPMSACELQVIRALGLWDAFLAWKRTVLDAVGPYWDFSGDPVTAGDERLFHDLMHLKAGTGHVILRHLLGEPCGGCGPAAARVIAAGVRVDAQTIGARLAAQRADRLPLTGRCADRVAAVLADRQGG